MNMNVWKELLRGDGGNLIAWNFVPAFDILSQIQETEEEVFLRNKGPSCVKHPHRAFIKFKRWTEHSRYWIY
jgi:hypothetical protein